MHEDLIEMAGGLAGPCASLYEKVAMMANLSSLLFWNVKDLNWIGFYLLKGDDLVLGPFHGQVACTMLKKGRGVCQKAIETASTVVVDDVEAFPGHIACDSSSRSEAVVCLKDKAGRAFGVLDADSSRKSRFDSQTVLLLEAIGQMVSKAWS